jgi:ketosteroid isomerase-like protein
VEDRAVQTGNPYSQRYSSVVEHHDGLITRHVDY